MNQLTPMSFEYYYGPSRIVVDSGSVSSLSSRLDDIGINRVVVVCGETVGQQSAVIDPVTEGLGNHLEFVFDETTPTKLATTALEAAERIDSAGVDGIVALGGGSSIDVARAASVFHAEDGPPETMFSSVSKDGHIDLPELDAEKIPVVAVPTTFSGAELTCAAGVNFENIRGSAVPSETRQGPIYDPAVLPKLIVYDPKLFATTPKSVLASSAMNGFDHGIETVYSRNNTAITDATAIHGLRLSRSALPNAISNPKDTAVMTCAIAGIVLTSFGFVDPEVDGNKYSLIHAFGHILSRYYEVQQGTVHGIVAPQVLEYIFNQTEGRRNILARGFDIDPTEHSDREIADAVVEEVELVRNGLGLPDQLRTIDGLERSDFPQIARGIVDDVGIYNSPAGFNPSIDEIQEVLRAVW